MGQAGGPDRDRGATGHVSRLLSIEQSQKTDTSATRDIDIDLTEDVAPSDFPVLVFLRARVLQLRSQNHELSDRIEKERHRVAPLERALTRERERAAEAGAEIKKLQRRIRRLERELAKLRSEDERQQGLGEQVGLLRRALISVRSLSGFTQGVDPKAAARVETVGKMAHLHKELMERNNGALTLGESLELRRRYYGDKVQASSALFGKRESKAILYRDVPEGKMPEPQDRIRLTEEGERLVTAYRRAFLRSKR